MMLVLTSGNHTKEFEIENEVVLKDFIAYELPDYAAEFMKKHGVEECDCDISGRLALKKPQMALGALFG